MGVPWSTSSNRLLRFRAVAVTVQYGRARRFTAQISCLLRSRLTAGRSFLFGESALGQEVGQMFLQEDVFASFVLEPVNLTGR